MKKIVLSILSGLAVMFLMMPVSVKANSVMPGVRDKTPDKNPCNPRILPDDIYKDFKSALAQFLESPVLGEIAKQIKTKTGKNPATVPVEIFLVDRNEFIKEYTADTKNLSGPKIDPGTIFDEDAAFTFTTGATVGGVQKIKVKFFCKDSLRTGMLDNDEANGSKIFRQMAHEFVHAKRYAILDFGGDPGFEDHDRGFAQEEQRLFDLLKTWLYEHAFGGLQKNIKPESVSFGELGVGDPGLLPTSRWYFVKEMRRGLQQFFTFDKVKKAALELRFTDEKLAETKKVSETNSDRPDAIAQALDNYQQSQEALKKRLESLKETSQNPNVDKLIEKLADRVVKHEKLFSELSTKTGNQAEVKEKIASAKEALENSVGEGAKKDQEENFAKKLETALKDNKVGDLKSQEGQEIARSIASKIDYVPINFSSPQTSAGDDHLFKIASVKGYSSSDNWPLVIEVREPDSAFATPPEGFSVQVYIAIPKIKTLFGGTAEFNGSTWNITVNPPKDAGSYRLSVYAYCGVDNSTCEKLYGRARQVEWSIDFTVGHQAAEPAVSPLISSPPSIEPKKPAASSGRCEELNNILRDLKLQYQAGKATAEEVESRAKPYQDELFSTCQTPLPPSPKPKESSPRCKEINKILTDLKMQYQDEKITRDELNSRAKPYQDESLLVCPTSGAEGERG